MASQASPTQLEQDIEQMFVAAVVAHALPIARSAIAALKREGLWIIASDDGK